MKKTLILLFLLSSLNTNACPDLTGKYYCQTSNGRVTNLNLSKETQAGIVSFIFIENGKEGRWIVDGKLRSLNSSPMDGVSNIKYSASCTSANLFVSMNGDLTELESSILMNVDLSLDDERNLIQQTSGSFSDGTSLPNVVAKCYRESFAERKR